MILVAFVLVLVATVMLIIGTFFDGGTAYIWISIGACVATFGVLAASYFARRRGAGDEGARPQPLGAGESRPASVQSAPRGQTVGAGGTVTATRERTEAEQETAAEDDTTVTIVPPAAEDTADDATEAEEAFAVPTGSDEVEPDEVEPDERDAEDGEAVETPAEPAPRRVAPRRVVRRAPAAATAGIEAGAESPAGADEVEEQAAPQQAAAAEAPTWPSSDEEAAAPAADADSTERVVRRAPEGGTRKVVRRAPAGEGTPGTRKVVRRVAVTGATRQVVRRAGGPQAGGQRTVKRVVRRAPAAGEGGAAKEQPTQDSATPDRSGTRGKRARAVLSEIKGVGPAKQDALLKRFGSLEKMAAASVADLAEVKGVGESVAETILRSLKDR